MGNRVDLDVAARAEEDQRHAIVRHHAAADLRDPREDGADVEHVRERPEQLDRPLEVRGARPLHRCGARRLGQALVRERHRDIARQPLHGTEIARGVRVGATRQERENPDERAVDRDRRRYPGSVAAVAAERGILGHVRDRDVAQDAVIVGTEDGRRLVARAGKQPEVHAVVAISASSCGTTRPAMALR